MMTPTIEQVKAFARKYAEKYSTVAYNDADEKALHTYHDAAGNPLYWRIRLKNTGTGEKWIRPFHFDGNDFVMGEPPKPESGKPLYGLHLLATRPDALVWITEGETPADALNKAFKKWAVDMQHVAMTSGGATSAYTADWTPLAGRRVVIWPDNDDPGAKYAADVCERLQGVAASVMTLDISGLNLPDKGDAFDWLQRDGASIDALLAVLDTSRINAATPAQDAQQSSDAPAPMPIQAGETFSPIPVVRLTCAADIKPEAIRWLWDGWLARGKLHIFAGQAGTGKTTIAIALAATVSMGGRFPDGSRAPVGNVLIWSGEDSAKDTLIPRLLAAGADMKRVHFIGDVQHGDELRSFDPATDIRAMADAATRIGDISMLIVDPVVNAVAGDSHKNGEVRRALQPLVDFGEKLGCAVLGISHFSKGTGGKDPLERVSGSLAFGALARIVLATAKITEGETIKRIFCRAKSNIGVDHGGYEYDLHQKEIEGHAGIFSSYATWGQKVEGSARELLAEPEPQKDDSELSAAVQFLQDELAEGAKNQKDIEQECKAAGFSVATLRRAKKQLGVVSRKEGGAFGGGKQVWVWKLPESLKMLKNAEDAQGAHIKNLEHLEHLQEIVPADDENEVLL